MPVLSLERLTFGGDAIGRLDGKAVFVPFGAPGDEADITIEAEHPRWARARLDQVRRAGPGRANPPCGWFGDCGGCQWQHLNLTAQHEAKHAIVAEQLERIGGIRDAVVAPVMPTPPWHYRDRVTLAVDDGAVGFRRGRSHDVVAIDACSIASPVVAGHLDAARDAAARFGTDATRVSIVGTGDGVVLAIALRRSATEGRTIAAEIQAARPTVRGVILAGGGRRATFGEVEVSRQLEPGLDVRVPADVFTQVSAAAYHALVSTTVQMARVKAGTTVLDLFAGAGTLGLPLARRGALVHGVERDRRAVRAARAAARRHGISTFRIAAGDVATSLRGRRDRSIDLVVLDPPRRGAARCLPLLLEHRPTSILYVSCDPATFARDVKTLVGGGYHLGRVQPIDAFPETFHVEMVAELRLT